MSEPNCVWDAKAVLGEGPVWVSRDQALYWVDIKQSMLHRYNVHDLSCRSWVLSKMISSVVAVQNDNGFIATFADGVFYIDNEINKQRLIADPEESLSNNRMNDGCCDQRGQYWFGSMDDGESKKTGSFYCLDLQGQCHKILSGIAITNGPTFSADGKAIYYTDTLNRTVYKARIENNHRLKEIKPFVVFQNREGYPDGMCTDNEGHLWVTHWGGFRVTRFTPNGQVDRVIELPVPNVSKCVFAGIDLNTLYITTARHGLSENELKKYPQSGGLFAVDLKDIRGFEVCDYKGQVPH